MNGQNYIQIVTETITRAFESQKETLNALSDIIAKTIEAGGCEIDGCETPPGQCHIHHPTRWADGGETNRDGIMCCPWHHHRAHDQRYTLTRLPTGKYTFHRRT
jgi:hypothetical protein